MSAQGTPTPRPGPGPFWIAVALAVVTLAVFCPVTGFQFVNFDDPGYVTANPHVREGLTGGALRYAWRSQVSGNWHPITMLSLMLDCQLFGVKPWWPHLENVLLHAANTVLLFGLLKRMTGAVWRSATVAALFALHPLHVESVAWVAERKDVLSTLFWFLTIWAYVRYVEKWRVESGEWRVFYGVSLVFFALGLMSKPMLVTVPCTLLLLDFWPLGRMKAGAGVWRLAAEKIPFFAMSAVMCAVAIRVQKLSGAMPLLESFPLGQRLGNALVSYLRYIEMMFWPRHLAGLYLIRLGQLTWREAALAALLLAAVSAALLTQWRRRPCLAAGWLWYVGTLVPVIGLVQVGSQSMADRYTYVPLIGLFVILVWAGWECAGAWGLGRFAAAPTAAVLAACAALTVRQELYWKNSETMNQRILDVTRDNYIAHNNLGVYYVATDRTNEAMAHFVAAVEENPHYAEGRCNLGYFYLKENRTNEAISNLTVAVQEKPAYAEAHNKLGAIFLGQKRFDEAIGHFQEAIRVKPDYAEACYNLGTALGGKGDIAEAMSQLREAIRLKPDYAEAHNNLGSALAGNGRLDEAIREFQEAIRLKADYAEARQNLARAIKTKDAH